MTLRTRRRLHRRLWQHKVWQHKVWRRARWSSVITAFTLLNACTQPIRPTATLTPAPTNTLSASLETWQTIAPGLERRLYQPGDDYPLTQLFALRINPADFTFRVHYRPDDPLPASGWRDELSDAAAILNANFFSADNRILGLLVSDGLVYGSAYTDRGGFFTVEGDFVRVRSTLAEPYSGEPFDQAVQAFPMLVADGEAAFFSTQGDRIARRTLIGQDSAGRIIVMVTSSLVGIRLVDLSAFLAGSDLELVNAFNLDGGGSTLMTVDIEGAAITIPSFDRVPAVLAIYERED